MVRNDLLSIALIALFAAPAADAITNCPASNKTQEVHIRVPACANVPQEFTVKVNGVDKTVIRDPKVAKWFVKMDKPFCISEGVLTEVNVPGFRTACEVKAKREGPASAPFAVFDVPCAPVWQLSIAKVKPLESKFKYTVKREAALACGDPGASLDTVAPDAIGDLGVRDDVVVSVTVSKNKSLDVTVKETFLRSKPAGARFGLLFRTSPARNEQSSLVDDAHADKVDLIFKKEKEGSK